MELDQFKGKLARWALILHEYDFVIVHRASKVNRYVNGLNRNPSTNEEDTTKAHWHGDIHCK
jgi:hypothetical protein